MEPDYIETARLLARFQQQVSRSLGLPVDLATMVRDPGYARRILADVELRTGDAELRATLGELRERLPRLLPGPAGGEGASSGAGRNRFLRFGRSE